MILTRRAALNGIYLDELHDSIVIRSVDPGVTQESISAVNRMGGAGQRMTAQHWETLEAKVGFAIDIHRKQLEERRQVFELACDWARGGGWLTVGNIPGRRLYADKVLLPGSGDLWDWTKEYTITFRAYNIPFWQEEEPVPASADLTDGQFSVGVAGNVQTVMDVTLQNISGANIKDITLAVNGRTMTVNNVNLGGSDTLRIHHGTDGILRAEVGETSVYEKLAGADDLYCEPGTATVYVKAQRALRVTASAVGRYV